MPEYGETQVWEIHYSGRFCKVWFLKQILIINGSKIVKRHFIFFFGSNRSINKKLKDKECLNILLNLVLITFCLIFISPKITSMKNVELLYRFFFLSYIYISLKTIILFLNILKHWYYLCTRYWSLY